MSIGADAVASVGIALSSLRLGPRILGGALSTHASAWSNDTVAQVPPEESMRVPMLDRGVSIVFLQNILGELEENGHGIYLHMIIFTLQHLPLVLSPHYFRRCGLRAAAQRRAHEEF